MAEAMGNHYTKRLGRLDTERSSWVDHWSEVSDYLMPRAKRFLVEDTNDGGKKHNLIYDNTAGKALDTLAAGMMAGMTSPARPWFRLGTTEQGLMERQPVKVWLNDITRVMRNIFSRSNTYRGLHNSYKQLGAFGSASSLVMEDFEDVIRLYPLTIGEYFLSQNHRQAVDTLYRKFKMQVLPMVQKFGKKNVSQEVLSLFENRNYDQWRTVIHAIEPRIDREPGKRDSGNMPFKSVYFEEGKESEKKLSESGFMEKPFLAPRWEVFGQDIYGQSPGMEALGDIKALQYNQEKKARAIDYQADPPVQVPASLKGSEDILPGGVTYYDQANPQGGIRTAFEVPLQIQPVLEDIQDIRARIRAAFHADLFQMLALSDRRQITAREIEERHEEKLLMLGPVLERLQNELLDPLIDRAFAIGIRSGLFPEPPAELQGMEIKVEYISMLAQAQKAVGIGSVDRLLGTVGAIGQIKPEALDKIDADKVIDAYADMLGVDPDLIVANDRVALIRQEREDRQQALINAQQVRDTAETAKVLSETDTEGNNALTNVTEQFTQL